MSNVTVRFLSKTTNNQKVTLTPAELEAINNEINKAKQSGQLPSVFEVEISPNNTTVNNISSESVNQGITSTTEQYSTTVEAMQDDSNTKEISYEILDKSYDELYNEYASKLTSGMVAIPESTSTDSTDSTTSTTSTDSTTSTNATTSQQTKEVDKKYQVRDGFDADAVAASLHKAMKPGWFGWGTDEKTVHKYLDTGKKSSLNDAELREVMAAYQEKYGVSLEDDIKGDFSFGEEDQLVGRIYKAQDAAEEQYSVMDDKEREKLIHKLAGQLYDAMDGLGTDEEAVYKVMQLDPEIRKQVIEYYNKSPYADEGKLKDRLDGEFSGYSQKQMDKLYNV